ncbi:MAG: sulfite exporter TauE/SafE family protein [Ruminococcaceae bacterium]|nr:sulfite exporter TauE/SafE family protein [Oscillospiraceae bacterium]
MIFDVIISFVLAALSGLGVGGGGLFVIFLAIFTDTPQLIAQGMNLLFFIFSASSSLIIHLTHRKIYASLIAVLAISGALGAILGTFVCERIDPNILRKIFGVMLVITGIFTLKKGREGTRSTLS